jgi:hypothetical protein
MTNKIHLKNDGSCNTAYNLYYPRLQINKRGEIVLAISKERTLTKGILVGKTPESKSLLQLGTKCVDWEVAGELTDYDGEITVTLSNRVKNGGTDNKRS